MTARGGLPLWIRGMTNFQSLMNCGLPASLSPSPSLSPPDIENLRCQSRKSERKKKKKRLGGESVNTRRSDDKTELVLPDRNVGVGRLCSVCSDTPIDTAHDSGQHGITLAGSEVNFHPAGGIDSAARRRAAKVRTRQRLARTRVRFFWFFFLSLLCVHCARCALARLSSSLRDEICCVGVCGEGKKTHASSSICWRILFSRRRCLCLFHLRYTRPPPPFPFPFPSASDGLERQRKTSVTSAQETR